MKLTDILKAIITQPGWRKVGITAITLILSACGVNIPDPVVQAIMVFLVGQSGVDAVKALKTQ